MCVCVLTKHALFMCMKKRPHKDPIMIPFRCHRDKVIIKYLSVSEHLTSPTIALHVEPVIVRTIRFL